VENLVHNEPTHRVRQVENLVHNEPTHWVKQVENLVHNEPTHRVRQVENLVHNEATLVNKSCEILNATTNHSSKRNNTFELYHYKCNSLLDSVLLCCAVKKQGHGVKRA